MHAHQVGHFRLPRLSQFDRFQADRRRRNQPVHGSPRFAGGVPLGGNSIENCLAWVSVWKTTWVFAWDSLYMYQWKVQKWVLQCMGHRIKMKLQAVFKAKSQAKFVFYWIAPLVLALPLAVVGARRPGSLHFSFSWVWHTKTVFRIYHIPHSLSFNFLVSEFSNFDWLCFGPYIPTPRPRSADLKQS